MKSSSGKKKGSTRLFKYISLESGHMFVAHSLTLVAMALEAFAPVPGYYGIIAQNPCTASSKKYIYIYMYIQSGVSFVLLGRFNDTCYYARKYE